MDYGKIASKVIENVGGKSNIKSVAHCATRLRFQLRDNELRNEDAISDLEGVKGVFLTQSQFQIIFGSGLVNLVCAEVQKQLGMAGEEAAGTENEKEEKKGNPLQRFVKLLSDIFVPIIPAIVAGGLLMGLNNLLTSGMFDGRSIIELYPQWQGLAAAINTFSNAPFVFLPVLIGFSATKKFGGNAFLGAAMAMIMVHPDLLNAYSIGVAEPPVWNIFGFEIAAIGYQGTVLPVLAVSWILATIEKKLHKITPTWLDNLTTPMVSLLVTAFLTFIAVGPVLREAGNLLAAGITWMYDTLGFIGGGIFGLLYAPITLTGMHHSFIAIETQLIAESATTGGSFIFSTASMNNVAQGAAVLAVLLMTRNEKMKSICSASSVSALLGITEPAMFGVTLKLKYPFYAAIIGSAVGSAYLAGTKTLAQALGAAGLPGFISMKPEDYLNFAIGLVLSISVSFVLTVIFWKKFNMAQEEGAAAAKTNAGTAAENENTDNTNGTEFTTEADSTAASRQAANSQALNGNAIVFTSPIRGCVKPICESADEAFASEAMGKGIAVDPTAGTVYAPCDGTISLLFPTNHAFAIRTKEGVEALVHIGIDTVNLGGQGFQSMIAEGDKVKKGQALIQVDLEYLKEQNINPQTMMLFPDEADAQVEVFPCEQGDEKQNAVSLVQAVK